MTKAEIIESFKEKYKDIDPAIPIEWQLKAKALDINTDAYVWVYDDSILGRPLNIFEEHFLNNLKQ